jgi:hypothetical protein
VPFASLDDVDRRSQGLAIALLPAKSDPSPYAAGFLFSRQRPREAAKRRLNFPIDSKYHLEDVDQYPNHRAHFRRPNL